MNTVLTIEALSHEGFASRRYPTGETASGLGRSAAGVLAILTHGNAPLTAKEITIRFGRVNSGYTHKLLSTLCRAGLVYASGRRTLRGGRAILWSAVGSHSDARSALDDFASSNGMAGYRALEEHTHQRQRESFHDYRRTAALPWQPPEMGIFLRS